MNEKIIAYKAMDKNMKCLGKQYEVGKTYLENKADCCNAGMHACENPLDVLHYYNVADDARFFKVECGGDISNGDSDSKFSCTEMTIKSELKITDFCKIGVEAVMKRVNDKVSREKNIASGDCSTAAASGSYSTAAASGSYSTAAASGDCSPPLHQAATPPPLHQAGAPPALHRAVAPPALHRAVAPPALHRAGTLRQR